MSSSNLYGLIRPGIARGIYPENDTGEIDWVENAVTNSSRLIREKLTPQSSKMKRFVSLVNRQELTCKKIDNASMPSQIMTLRQDLINGFNNERTLARAFALIKELSDRTIGMRHHDVQLMGGWVMLNGMLAEMQTGEGKTLTATLPACTAALAGIPVHIISVNDYLVQRDAELMLALYTSLGLSVGTITEGMSVEDRQVAYQCDICYCTGKQLVFDYLKDRLIINQKNQNINHLFLERLHSTEKNPKKLLLRGLCFAVIDEADSVLIDEARTPLILSKQGKNQHEEAIYQYALFLANQLLAGRDYKMNQSHKSITFTKAGIANLSSMVKHSSDFWRGNRRRLELVKQALTAEKFYLRDQHYLVQDKKVIIIDEHTGRSMPDRKWEQGLHQMIEIKEGCEPSNQNETLAKISYQRFFRRYLRLAGMTGTAKEVSSELYSVYRLASVEIPTHKPARRVIKPAIIYKDTASKYDAIITSVKKAHQQYRPVLIATRTVELSELLSKKLSYARLPHQVLNARQDEDEASIIAQAGQARKITLATNMAGRGTDIKLANGVAETGGLHVICCEPNVSRRIDRQVMGRCGRQGDPGTVESFYSLQDEVIQFYLDLTFLKVMTPLLSNQRLLYRAQRAIEKQHRALRQSLLKSDLSLGTLLAFSGSTE